MKLAMLIPKFPGQTQIWMWREIQHLRRWDQSIRIFSTCPPVYRAPHAFTQEAERETCYLWPRSILDLAHALAWAALTRPLRLARCIGLALSLPVDRRPRWVALLPLVVPACVLAREATRDGIDHMHSQTCSNSAILAMMLKRLTGIPYSLTLNANISWWGGAMREKFGDAAFTMTHTQWLYDELRRDYPGLRPDQALRGYIGVDTAKWKRPPGSERAAGDEVRVLSVGRLHPSKGHDTLIRAFDGLRRHRSGVTLTIIGDGPQRPELEALIEELGLATAVTLAGSQSEDRIIECMLEADLFVGASRAEPLGVVFMEAMSMEVATIGTAAGGVGEIITDGVDGLLVEPGDVEGLAEAMQRLGDDAELRRALGAAGRRSIVDRFDSRVGAATFYERLNGRAPSEPESAPCHP